MNLYEYQGKELFARYGIPVPPGQVAMTPEEARDIAARIGGTVVVKAQVHAGGGGAGGGGPRRAGAGGEAARGAGAFWGLRTRALPGRRVLVTQAAEIARELYLAIVMDRQQKLPLV